MKLNIPSKLVEFDKIIYDPFCIFEMNNFFENHVYDDLSNNFPSQTQFEGIHQNGKKIFFNNRHKNFYKFINSNIWGEFYNHLNKKEEINKLIELIKPDVMDDETLSKIIKIMVKTPKIGESTLDNLSDLSSNSFAWTTKEFNKNIQLKQYQIVNENKVFYPWKLIYKK